MVIPKTLRKEILFWLHDDVISGHLGFKKTWDKVKKRFFWPKMLATVKNYVFSCQKCNAQKSTNRKPAGFMQPVTPTDTPFEKIGIDKMGPFPISSSGNKHIVVCTDYCTKFVVAAPVKDGTAGETAKFLIEKVILTYGSPKEIITDRGKEFANKIIAEVTKSFSINHRKTTSFHPRSNGQTERFNKTLANMISNYVNGSHDNWDKFIPHLIFAYNSSIHESTGYSPFLLTHGYEPNLPIDTLIDVPDRNSWSLRNLEIARKKAKETIQIFQEKAKLNFDKQRRHEKFEEGQLVYVKYPNRKVGKSEKLLNQYRGPCEILRQTAENNYEIKYPSRVKLILYLWKD